MEEKGEEERRGEQNVRHTLPTATPNVPALAHYASLSQPLQTPFADAWTAILVVVFLWHVLK